jgi:hypothetical protein
MIASLPSASCCRTNGGTDQPTSICLDITCVSVAGAPPVATILGVTFACWMSCSRMRLVEEPGEENATVLPAVSARLAIPAFRPRIPERVGRAGRLRADDLHRHALGVGGDSAERAVGHGDVDRAGDHRGERRSAAFRIEDVDVEAGFLEEPLLDAELDEARVPEAALSDRNLECFGTGARCGQRNFEYDRKCEGTAHDAESSLIPACLSSHGPGRTDGSCP